MTTKPSKSKLPFLLIGVHIALAIVLFMTSRPVAPQEKVVQDDGEARVYEPVVYDVENWASTPKQGMDIEQLKAKSARPPPKRAVWIIMAITPPNIDSAHAMNHRSMSWSQMRCLRLLGIMPHLRITTTKNVQA